MPNETDALSDQAMAASKTAAQTHTVESHKAAAMAHANAFQCANGCSRPSLAQHHLQEAAKHDRHADPTTPEGKGEAAHRATMAARSAGTAKAHRDAETAHKDASQAFREAGNSKGAMKHDEASYEHGDAARRIENPPPKPMSPPPVPG